MSEAVKRKNRCEFLYWKGLFLGEEHDPTCVPSGDRLFWCQKTQTCLGPDNRLVDDYECNETRSCYRPA